jgi:hypothetical protein
MVRISEIHADGRAAKTYLAMLGRPDLDLLPHEVVRRAFLVDHRRHSHAGIVAVRCAIVAGERFGPCRTVFDW